MCTSYPSKQWLTQRYTSFPALDNHWGIRPAVVSLLSDEGHTELQQNTPHLGIIVGNYIQDVAYKHLLYRRQ